MYEQKITEIVLKTIPVNTILFVKSVLNCESEGKNKKFKKLK